VVFDLLDDTACVFAEHELKQFAGFLMQVRVGGMRGDGIEILRDGTDVAVDGPLVVVEDDDEALGVCGNVVHRFKHRTAGEGSVTGDADDVLVTSGEITPSSHAEGGGESGAGVACAVAIVFAFSSEQEAIQAMMLTNGVYAVPAAGEHLVDVALMRDVEDEAILGRVEDAVQSDGKLHDAEIRPEMAAGLAEGFDECLADFFREFGEFLQRQGFEVGGGVDGRQLGVHRSKKVGFRRLRSRRFYVGGADYGVFRQNWGLVRLP